jgi:hypothetical protein
MSKVQGREKKPTTDSRKSRPTAGEEVKSEEVKKALATVWAGAGLSPPVAFDRETPCRFEEGCRPDENFLGARRWYSAC